MLQMAVYADRLADHPEYNALPPRRALAAITAQVKKMFPENFDNGRKKVVGTQKETPRVEPTTTRSKGALPTKADLSFDQQEMMKNILAVDPEMTEKEYIKKLHEMGEV